MKKVIHKCPKEKEREKKELEEITDAMTHPNTTLMDLI
jgi:hypothetical protein